MEKLVYKIAGVTVTKSQFTRHVKQYAINYESYRALFGGNNMNASKVTLANGDSYTTSHNSTTEEFKAYLGDWMEIGDTEEHPYDSKVRIVSVERVTL